MEESNPVTKAFQTMSADTPSLMGSAVRPAEPLGSVPKRKEGQSSIARRRANSSLPELGGLLEESHTVLGTSQQPDSQSSRLVGANRQFDASVRNLIDDKYNKEYKLDRETRVKAIEILFDYFNKNQFQVDVSVAISAMHPSN